MKNSKFFIVFLFFILICLISNLTTTTVKTQNGNLEKINLSNQNKAKLSILKSYGKIPLYFIKNRGQFNKNVLFYTKTRGYTLWITKEGLVFDSIIREKADDKKGKWKDKTPEFKVKGRDISKSRFLNHKKDFKIIPVDNAKYRVNYFIGNKTKWINNIKTSKGILLTDIYKNIDLKIYGIEKLIEYDWIVKEGGNPEDIEIEYKDIKKTKIDKEGNIVIEMKFGKIMHKRPVSYQIDKKGKREYIKSEFIKTGKNRYRIKVQDYDKTRELIIDPVVLIYSTYLGGSGNDRGYGIAVDDNGCTYVTGYTESNDFPTQNPYQTNQPNNDIFITKFSSDGQSLEYSTYLGGSNWDKGYGIAVDSNGCAYVTGTTYSDDFPTKNRYQTYQHGRDVFVTKLSSDGNTLIYSTYLGGVSWDEGYGIVVDRNGCAYVTGYTYSVNFPTKNPYQTNQPGRDVFITKFSSDGSSLIYSTHLGGNDWDEGYGIAIDRNGNAYVTGYTYSGNFPTKNPYQTNRLGYEDVFVTKLSSDGQSLEYSTYLGGSNWDKGYGIAVDSNGCAYVTGYTWSNSGDFPTKNPYQTNQPGEFLFITKFSSSGQSLEYSTCFGGSGWDEGHGIAVDSNGCAYITGYTNSDNFPVKNPYQTNQPRYDVFVTKFSSDGQSLVYSTYIGGSDNDYGKGIAVDSNGFAYITGYTNSDNFPVKNPYQTTNTGNNDVFITKLALQWTVSASISVGNGNVSPESQGVIEGETATINIIPDTGYYIDSITDNGVSVPVSNPYYIHNVNADHTVVVKFKLKTYTVNASVSGGHGRVSPASQTTDYGQTATINIIPDLGYEIESITDNEISKPISNPYKIENVTEDHDVFVKFKPMIAVSLSGERKTEKAWIIRKEYGKLDIMISNPSGMDYTLTIQKSTSGSGYSNIKSVKSSEISGGEYTYYDKFLKKGVNYGYRVVIKNSSGNIMRYSKTINL